MGDGGRGTRFVELERKESFGSSNDGDREYYRIDLSERA